MNEIYSKPFHYVHKKNSLRGFIRRVYNSIMNRFITEPTIFLNRNPRYAGWEIGDYTYGSPDGSPHLVSGGENVKIRIGKFCSIAHDVTFILGNHRVDWVSTYPFPVFFSEAQHITGHPLSNGDINVGNDVWIGKFVTILSGVKIGNGAVIAVNSVVTKDVPPYAIVAGNPAKIIRMRFDDETIKHLQTIQWWNWDIQRILANIDLILQPDPEQFVTRHA